MVPLQSDHRSSGASSLTHGLDNSFWLHIKQTLHTHSVECLELQQTYSNYLLLILQAIFSKAVWCLSRKSLMHRNVSNACAVKGFYDDEDS